MRDNIIQHRDAIDVFKEHVVMAFVNTHFMHTTDVRVVEEHREGSLTKGTDLLKCTTVSLFVCILRSTTVVMGRRRVDTRDDFDSDLHIFHRLQLFIKHILEITERTLSPVTL
jgi:hypothetical protein